MSCHELNLNKYYDTILPMTRRKKDDSFSTCISNYFTQVIGQHMVKLKVNSSMKQYVKNKPIKWGLKFWYRCESKTEYLYQYDL